MEKLSIEKVKDYLKGIIVCDKWYTGAMDKNQSEAIAIYANRRPLNKISGFPELQTYSILPITLLLRWSKDYVEAEKKANEIFNSLNCKTDIIDNYNCIFNGLYEGPIDLRT